MAGNRVRRESSQLTLLGRAVLALLTIAVYFGVCFGVAYGIFWMAALWTR